MPDILQHRRGTTMERGAVVLASAELFFDETLTALYIGNGSTAGGVIVGGSTPGGIAQLGGDVLAGPAAGSTTATLATTGVTPGTYSPAAIVVDGKGRVISASTAPGGSGTTSAGITALTGDVLAGPGSGTQIATLGTTGVTAGTYSPLGAVVDAKGRIVSASTAAGGGTSAAGITALTGDVLAGPGSGTQAATLGTTGVIPGTYFGTQMIVDAKGRILSATSDGPVSTITTSVHTVGLSDISTWKRMSNTSTQVVVIPPASTVAFPLGSIITWEQINTGPISFTTGAGATLAVSGAFNPISGGQFAVVQTKKVDSDTWNVFGNLDTV